LASTISRDDIIAVIGARTPSIFPATDAGVVCFFGFWLIPKPLPTKRVDAKVADTPDRTSRSADRTSRSLTLSSICFSLKHQTIAAPKLRREEAA
jgi:hypothetical protein